MDIWAGAMRVILLFSLSRVGAHYVRLSALQ